MLKRVKVSDLRVGMYVQEFCGSWIDHPFFRSRFLIDGPERLQRIRDSEIDEVVIDLSRGLDVAPPAVETPEAEPAPEPETPAPRSAAPKPRLRHLSEELGQAMKLCQRSKQAVVDMFADVRMGRAIQVEQAAELVEEISASVMRHPNALISLARLKTSDEYTYMHSVAVCALMIAVARQLALDEAQVREAGLAGLLHDLGKIAIPDPILNKPGKLTDEEFAVVRGHPGAGAELLRQSRQVSEPVIDVCLHHHEKMDGSGYPHGLAGDAISLMAKIGAVCDVYDAITSNRPYKRGWDPAESMRRMAEWKGHFDPVVFQAFVKSVGIYPVGSLVRLESGKLGLVVEQGEKSLLAPQVKVFFSARSKTPIPQQVIDLGKAGVGDRIVGCESPEKWGFRNLDELWSGLSARGGSLFG